ncbi:MAG: SH3 domain-containing protein [Actinomycetota bacterium]
MKRRTAFLFLSALAFTAAAALWIVATPAMAQVSGPCTVTLNGVDANQASTPQTAVEVDYRDQATIQVQSTSSITSHKVMLEFAGFRWTASSGADTGSSWQGVVDIAKYATYGVGLYKVVGESTGPGACSGAAFVKVTGKNPLGTVAGAGAAAATAVGVVGMAAAAASSAREITKAGSAMGSIYERMLADEARRDAEEDRSDADAIRAFGPELGLLLRYSHFCLMSAPLAAFQTLAFMVAGAGMAGAPGPISLPRVPFRPRISVVSILGSLLATLGVIVLLQQFGVVYPTVTVVVVGLVLGLVLGLLVPSLVRLSGLRRLNARIGALEQRIGAAAAAPAWSPTHRVPAEGMQAWAAPDPASSVVARLDPGLELRVDEVAGAWARVTASNGWTGWVDGRLLVQMGGGS